MAEVFLARRRGPAGIEKRLVVKRIRRERAADPRFVQMFLREARLSVSLAHENIVPVFDFGRAGDELFLAMEHVEGCDLATALLRAGRLGRPLDPVLVAYLGVEACQGLDYAHRKRDESGKLLGVVHRDVTPRNLLLSLSGEVKLTDFGVAVVEADVEGAGKVRGTPAYMSPEQARGEPVDARADLFALGLVLWEALEGRRAYDGGRPEVALEEARAGQVPPLSERVPEALRRVVTMATRVDLGERYGDARAMQAALDAIVVVARAREPEEPAPSHRIAAWVKEVLTYPGPELDAEVGEIAVPSGPVVTYAEDGAAEVERSLILAGTGRSTMRSMAVTAAEEDLPAPAGDPVHGDRERLTTEPVRPRKQRGWRFLYVAAGPPLVLALVLASAWLARRSAQPQARATLAASEPVRAVLPPVSRAPAPRAAPTPPISILPIASPMPARPRLHPKLLPAAHLKVNSTPWSYVTIDGGAARYETPFSLDLPSGTHVLRFANPVGRVTQTRTVTLDGGQTLEVIEVLR